KRQNAGRPHGCCATKMGKKHLANHRLANEKEECANEECRSEDLQDCRFASNRAAEGAVYEGVNKRRRVSFESDSPPCEGGECRCRKSRREFIHRFYDRAYSSLVWRIVSAIDGTGRPKPLCPAHGHPSRR